MTSAPDGARDVVLDELRSGAVLMGRSVPAAGEYSVRSAYADLLWTPVLGPSVSALLRWSSYRLTVGPPEIVDTWEIVEALGRLAPTKAAAVLTRALQYSVARLTPVHGAQAIVLRSSLAELGPSRLNRLSPRLRGIHDRVIAAKAVPDASA